MTLRISPTHVEASSSLGTINVNTRPSVSTSKKKNPGRYGESSRGRTCNHGNMKEGRFMTSTSFLQARNPLYIQPIHYDILLIDKQPID